MEEITLLKIEAVAKAIGVSEKHIYRLIRQQGFPKPIKIGRSSRWKKSDIAEWIKSCTV